MPNTQNMRDYALRYLDRLEGGGGTEMMSAIHTCLAGQCDPGRLRVVCFMTDGYVGNDMDIIEAVRQNAGSARVFTFGIGKSTNRYLLDEMARAGRGEVQYVLSKEASIGAAERFQQRVRAPVLTDVRIDFGDLPVEEIYGAWPDDSADVHLGDPPEECESGTLDDLFREPTPAELRARAKADKKSWRGIDDLFGTPAEKTPKKRKKESSSDANAKKKGKSKPAAGKRRKKVTEAEFPREFWPDVENELVGKTSGVLFTRNSKQTGRKRLPKSAGLIAPDLFSSKPLVIKGRYRGPATGTITVHGLTGAGPFERRIKVHLPDEEWANDVLAPLWARAKVDHLMHQDLNGVQSGSPDPAIQEEILGLGLEYKLLTPYTSFVAVERSHVTRPGSSSTEHVRADIPKKVSRDGNFGQRYHAGGINVELDPNGDWTAPRSDLLREIGPYMGSGYYSRGQAARAAVVRQAGGNSASESAVAAGLKWLAEHQAPDGSWSFHPSDEDEGPAFSNPGTRKSKIHATGLALMAFLGAGQTHKEGSYKATVKSGLAFLLLAMKIDAPCGDLRGEEGCLLTHAVATIAITEAYAMTRDRNLLQPAQLAINFLSKHRHPESGGWGPKIGEAPSTVVSAWHLMALKSGHLAFLKVNPETVRGMTAYLDQVQTDGGARYGRSGPEETPVDDASSAAGLLCRMYLGWKHDHPALVRGVQHLSKAGPSKSDLMYNYFANQVLRHYGNPEWQAWNPQLRDHLINTQEKAGRLRGSWFNADGTRAAEGGRLMQTAMNIMLLEVYYRHMPIYRKNATVDDFQL